MEPYPAGVGRRATDPMPAAPGPCVERPAHAPEPELAAAGASLRGRVRDELDLRSGLWVALMAIARGVAIRAFETRAGRLLLAARYRAFGSLRADLFELDRPVGAVPPSQAAYPAGYAFREAGRREAAACSRVMRLPGAESLRRFEAGDACFVVADGSRPATVIWVHDGPCYVRGLGYTHEGEAGEKYVYGIVTDRAHRGKGLYKNALEDLAARLFSDGASRLVQMVEAGNTPVLSTIPRLGYRRTRMVETLLVLGVMRTVVTPVRGGPAERAWRVAPPRGRFVI